MATEKLVQTSFVNGQYDREVQSKERSDFIGQGLAKALNVVSSEKGELRKRLGTKHLLDLEKATVLIPFRMNDEDDAIIAVDASETDNVRGYRYVGGELQPLLTVPNESSVAFPVGSSWADGQEGDTSITNGDWTVEASFFGSVQPGYLFNNINSTYGAYPRDGYPTMASAPSYITIINSNDDLCMRGIKIWFWTVRAEGYAYRYLSDPVIQYSDDGITWTGVQTNYDISDYTQVAYKHYGHGLPDGYISKCFMTITQTNYAQNHRYWRVYFMSDKAGGGVLVDSASFVDVSAPTIFEQTVAYTEEDLKKIKYAQDSNEMFIACEGIIPQRLVNNTGVLSFNSFTPANTQDLWSTIGGYPTSVALFQNRLWFGGFQNNPQTVIASKFGDYETFDKQNPLQFDDYLNLRCNQLKTQITNIIGGQKVLYAFSEDGLSLVDSGTGGMIATNQSTEFNLRNRMPSGGSTPAFKDDVMLYGSSDGTKLYAVDYDLITERFQVDDLAKYAKDITFDKITELHYVNDESKMIYGLLESGNMFALNYKKGVYQGFFPFKIQDGYVYDIVQIKVGRNYKLLLVTNRSNRWYIEEMPDKGVYIDTIAPFMTKEDKKWATYDNINNNIALDCWQKYDDTLNVNSLIDYETSTMTTDRDLTRLVGSMVRFEQTNNEKSWVVAEIGSVDFELFGWSGPMTAWTTSATPVADDPVLDINGNAVGFKVVAYTPDDGYGNETLAIIATSGQGVLPGYTLTRNAGIDRHGYNIVIDSQRENATSFDTILLQFTQLPVKGSLLGVLGVVSQGQYLGEYNVTSDSEQLTFCGWKDGSDNYVFTKSSTPNTGDQLYDANGKRITTYYQNTVVSYDSENDRITVKDTSQTTVQFNRDSDSDYVYGGIIELPKPVFKATYGALYDAYAFIKIERPYESMKTVRQINLEVQNTMHLSVGTSLDDMQVLEDINDNTHYDLTNMTMNGGYVIVPGDTPEWSKFIIMKSDRGLPFTVNAVEVIINYSNEGGN